jgi:hypothetical protein
VCSGCQFLDQAFQFIVHIVVRRIRIKHTFEHFGRGRRIAPGSSNILIAMTKNTESLDDAIAERMRIMRDAFGYTQ